MKKKAGMTNVVVACALFMSLAAHAVDRTWGGGKWTDPDNYDPAGEPEEGDNLIIPDNVTVKLVSTDAASWEIANRFNYIKPQTATSFFEVDVPSGEASLKCGVSYNASDWLSNDKGGLVKKGGGTLQLMKTAQRAYYTSITVDEGVLRAPSNIENYSSIQYDKLHVAANAVFFIPRGQTDAGHPIFTFRGLSGSGTVTNDSSYVWGEDVVLNAGTSEFSGRIGGRIRLYAGANLTLLATDNTMTGQYFRAYNNAGKGVVGPKTSFVKMGMLGEPSSLGASPIAYGGRDAGDEASGYLLYLGTGETSDKPITLMGTTLYPSYFDAGAHGGLNLTGKIGLSSSPLQNYTFVLTGSNSTECAIYGNIADSGAYAITNIVKRGVGAWRFADAARSWSGALTVEEGTLRYDSLAPVGTACALGTAANAEPYPVLLKGGVFEYTGATRLDAAGRTVAVSGRAAMRNASGRAFRLDGVTSAADGSTLVLDGAAGVTNTLSGVTGGLSLCKTGEGAWLLDGEQSFTGDLTVSNGTLLVTRPKYEYYRLWFRHTVSNQTYFYVNEIGLYDKLGARQNGMMSFNMDKNSATALGPGEACIGVSGRTYSYVSATTVFSNLFDDDTSSLHAYQSYGGSAKSLKPDDESTWLPIVMRLGEDAAPVESYDIVIGGTYTANGKTRSIDNYLLQGSVDGVSWDNLNETNGYKQIGANYQWFFGGNSYATGDAATHTTGKTIAARPVSQPTLLDNAGYVSVAPNATIRALVDDVAISKIRISASGAGTIDNFRLAAGGTIDVTGVGRGVVNVTLPLTIANATEGDIANLAGWSLKVNGSGTSAWTKSVSPDGKVRISKKGLVLVYR